MLIIYKLQNIYTHKFLFWFVNTYFLLLNQFLFSTFNIILIQILHVPFIAHPVIIIY